MISARTRPRRRSGAGRRPRVPVGVALAASSLGVLGTAGAPLPVAAAAVEPGCVGIASRLDATGAESRGRGSCPAPHGDPAADGRGSGGGARGAGGAGDDDGGVAADGAPAAAAPDPFERARTPDCPGNAPGAQGVALCNAATLTCPDPGDVRYVTYRRPRGDDGPWTRDGIDCLSAAEAAVPPGGQAAAPVVVTAEQFRRLPIAPATSVTEPPGGQLLINLPTPVHAVAQVQVLPMEVLGVPVAVRATPATYAWDFGDGETLGPVADPGAPWPAGPHAHTYLAPGRFGILMSTTYTGEFSVGGGAWQPIGGTSTIASPLQPVVAHAARSALVGDTLS